ncbi:MAG TPA: hypothetical protein RMH99_09610 [Sandaracinaceae bacterium LLY-WYZ-13_1]|nr:hypothetical protein [Sandaracinaceae bacterium LLY-WYZ-13_1]
MTEARAQLVVREDAYDADVRRLCETLLDRTALVVAGVPHRLREVEAYYFGARHRDPFAHRDPLQREPGRWYFHRRGGTYRGGSFKGLDLTFGAPGAFGGVLLRTLEPPDGALISGPSLLVDALLEATGAPRVADLHRRAPDAFDRGAPLHLADAPPRGARILRTARVGLTLKRATGADARTAYLMRPDRFLDAPRAVRKGRVHVVVALHLAGLAPGAIRARTGSPRRSIEGWIAAFEEGRRAGRFEPFLGRDASSRELAFLAGVWHREHAAGAAPAV